jgi:hypothetical protein
MIAEIIAADCRILLFSVTLFALTKPREGPSLVSIVVVRLLYKQPQ